MSQIRQNGTRPQIAFWALICLIGIQNNLSLRSQHLFALLFTSIFNVCQQPLPHLHTPPLTHLPLPFMTHPPSQIYTAKGGGHGHVRRPAANRYQQPVGDTAACTCPPPPRRVKQDCGYTNTCVTPGDFESGWVGFCSANFSNHFYARTKFPPPCMIQISWCLREQKPGFSCNALSGDSGVQMSTGAPWCARHLGLGQLDTSGPAAPLVSPWPG